MVLVWSEAWRAEGEEKMSLLHLQAYSRNGASATIAPKRVLLTFGLAAEVRRRPGHRLILRLGSIPSFGYAAAAAMHRKGLIAESRSM